MSNLISIDNGLHYKTAEEAWPEIEANGLWDCIVQLMDDDVRERVHATRASCDEKEFLAAYLDAADQDLVIG